MDIILTTTDGVPGREIAQCIGLVKGSLDGQIPFVVQPRRLQFTHAQFDLAQRIVGETNLGPGVGVLRHGRKDLFLDLQHRTVVIARRGKLAPALPDLGNVVVGSGLCVEAVIEQGYVDTDRMYVTGCSGGGVLSSWVIAHTDRFAAASAFSK